MKAPHSYHRSEIRTSLDAMSQFVPSWRWTYGDGTTASIDFQGGRREIILDYRIRSYSEDWQSVRQRVPIRWTPCRFGGERPWFVCDVHANGVYCGRRVAKLYGAGRLFACRYCYRLGYAIQRDGTGRWTELIIACGACIAS
jgi:hypothetical protein